MRTRIRPTLVQAKHVFVQMPDLQDMSVTELKKFAKDKGIRLDTGLKKAEIIKTINEKVGVE